MADSKQFRNLTEFHNGDSAEDNIKLTDISPFQHEDITSGTNKLGRMIMAQTFCEPVAICDSNDPSGGAYVATCVNYPDFSVTYDDSRGQTHILYGLKVRVIFTHGITYGSVDSGTYPTLSINGSGALPLLAQGKPMASGSVVAGQSIELTIIPYGNSIAFDADSNVREITSDYVLYTDGSGHTKHDVIVSANTTLTGAPIAANDVIRVYFSDNIAGSNTSSVLVLNYNGTNYNVKVGKNGSLANFVASEISSGTYRYVQKYTTLELLFDGTQFIIVGNPVVCSSSDYTIYADGTKARQMLGISRTATTSLGGTVGTPLSFATDTIIGIDVTSAENIVGVPFVYGSNQAYQIYFFDWATKQSIVSTSVSYTIYYYKK